MSSVGGQRWPVPQSQQPPAFRGFWLFWGGLIDVQRWGPKILGEPAPTVTGIVSRVNPPAQHLIYIEDFPRLSRRRRAKVCRSISILGLSAFTLGKTEEG
ncbi:hypothetical protein [Kamptonema formosum]|uniref:hypothetical protein n=1 Tax=Kamptonema formosum TaxID=331992 RepID=UPI00036AB39A|nr:hypothetical protein [Oscillatoria sp. PCC 10802]